MGLILGDLPGQTPLEEEELEGLRIPGIATRGELDEFEQQNIEQAIQWVLMHPLKQDRIFTEAFVTGLHKRMYGQVWSWAGTFRRTDKNIGTDKWNIGPELKYLLDDIIYWTEHQVYAPDEAALRFKHRLVSIHCFPNGNGRHSRLMADIIAEKVFKKPVFSWGATTMRTQGVDARTAYLKAVRAADKGDILPLLDFARS